jgi:hypothetical protein
MNLFREHRIFGETGNRSVIYICLEDLQTGRFTIQQAEFFDPDDASSRAGPISSLTLELFAERPRNTATWHGSILDAIAAHNEDFEGFFDTF